MSNAASVDKLVAIGVVASVVAAAVAGGTYLDGRNRESAKSEVKRVVTVLDGSLVDAAKGRSEMLKLNVRVNHCRIWPADAATKVGLLVEANRAHVALDTAEIGSASDSDAQTLVNTFTRAMNWSRTADKEYGSWLLLWNARYLGVKSRGCAKPFRSDRWDAFGMSNASASDAKRRFLASYNVWAQRFGFRHNWKPTDF